MNEIFKQKRGDIISPSKKNLKFKNYKKNIFSSLNDVECFLDNYNNFRKLFNIYKYIK